MIDKLDKEPTPEEIENAASILSRLTPGFLPKPLFLEVTRLTTTPIVELVPLRDRNGATEVLLTRRDQDDPNWPNMLHTPGTVVLATDDEGDFTSALERIISKELGGTQVGEPSYVGSILHRVNRGMEAAQIYLAPVSGEPMVGQFYPVTDLPEDVVDTQLEFIHSAAQLFEEQMQK
jgi:hypothetical protein